MINNQSNPNTVAPQRQAPTLSLGVLAFVAIVCTTMTACDNTTPKEPVKSETITDTTSSDQSDHDSTLKSITGKDTATLITFDPEEIKQGGSTGIAITSSESYSKPSSNITASRKGDFFIGNAFFRQPWVVAPASTDSRDGLGALFNVSSCQSCHIKDGRGHAPLHKDDDADSMLIRLAMPTTNEDDRTALANSLVEKIPHPIYGGQLQDRGIEGVPAEAKISTTWRDVPVTFSDGYIITLREPTFRLTQAGYGEFGDEVILSPRVAPPMIGLGLLEQIPMDTIQKNAKLAKPDGVTGKFNWVQDLATGTAMLGRFGWKAGQARLLTQNQTAFNEDMGLTSSIHPKENCTHNQPACLNAKTGADFVVKGKPAVEVSDDVAKFVEFYTRNLAVPHRRQADSPKVLKGKQLFYQMNCHTCHTPRYELPTTDDDHLEQHGQVIYPYTDLLLHNMGEGLADRTLAGQLPKPDDQIEYLATAYDWRTPPLWGIGLAQTVDKNATFLHDGRARTPMEAVLWHGGEAQPHKERVLKLDKEGRQALMAFLDSL